MTQVPRNHEMIVLANSFPTLSEKKLDSRLRSMQHMISFYGKKASAASEEQARMFRQFISSIQYAITIIKIHRSLTSKISELAGEATDHETRTNSES